MRRLALLLLALGLLAALGASGKPEGAAAPELDDCRRALHVLNRLGFGPRPGDVDRVLSGGIPAYVESQLHPERLPDPEADQRLDGLPTLRMSEAELLLEFDRPERDARRFLEKERSKQTPAGRSNQTPDEQAKVFQARLQAIVTPARRRERVLEELTQARIIRAVFSDRQLNEVLVDFWMNHFNVFAGKDADRVLIASFENDVVRPRIWGCFRDLLLATARSPAMLLYLDNAQSAADAEHRPGPEAPASVAGANGGKTSIAGLNENYARELLELHTLGVEGGYGELDVQELARILTGWSIAPPEEGGGFAFHPKLHDVCAKTLLGRAFAAGRFLDEGESALDLLARHPSTARHIAFGLCQRFVADDPPAALVTRVAARFRETDGDLRETVRSLVTSPEFFDPRFYRTKVKSPFEYVVSALRATGAVPQDPGGAAQIARQIASSGEPLYLCLPPTGYSETGAAWVNTGALLARWNFSLALAGNRIAGVRADLAALLPPPARSNAARAVPALERALLAGDVSEGTRRRIAECVLELDAPSPEVERGKIALAAGNLLGSPEFQRR